MIELDKENLHDEMRKDQKVIEELLDKYNIFIWNNPEYDTLGKEIRISLTDIRTGLWVTSESMNDYFNLE